MTGSIIHPGRKTKSTHAIWKLEPSGGHNFQGLGSSLRLSICFRKTERSQEFYHKVSYQEKMYIIIKYLKNIKFCLRFHSVIVV